MSVGDRVQARDRYGDWYDAKVTNERGEGANREVKVHFVGWSRTRDEWVGGDKLRTATPRLANRGVRGMAPPFPPFPPFLRFLPYAQHSTARPPPEGPPLRYSL